MLTSNLSSLPEVTGTAAILIDPRSANEIAAGLDTLLTSPSLRESSTSAPWERIFYGEFDGRRDKRVLIKIIGE